MVTLSSAWAHSCQQSNTYFEVQRDLLGGCSLQIRQLSPRKLSINALESEREDCVMCHFNEQLKICKSCDI